MDASSSATIAYITRGYIIDERTPADRITPPSDKPLSSRTDH